MFLATAIKGFYGAGCEPTEIDTNSHVPALRELVHTMNNSSTTIVYDTDHGKILLKHLHKREKMAVSMCSMPKGSDFPEHNHKVIEWLHVESGELEFRLEGKEPLILRAGESVYIKPGKAHSAIALTPVEVLAVTMPADEGFPDEQ